MSISLVDGTDLVGRVVAEAQDSLIVVTSAGTEVRIPRAAIVALELAAASTAAGRRGRPDPNYSRLLFAPTGTPLRQGEGYFSDYYVVFPGISYGLTDRLSLMGGVSVVPAVGLDEQLFSVAPRIGLYVSDQYAVSIGTLLVAFGGEGSGGIVFAIGTRGRPDKQVTVGLGWGYVNTNTDDVEFADYPILMVGGNVRLSDSMALVSENWFYMDPETTLDQQPLGIALRFFGERIAVDVGAIIVGEVISQGLPIPWLSFVYHFGR